MLCHIQPKTLPGPVARLEALRQLEGFFCWQILIKLTLCVLRYPIPALLDRQTLLKAIISLLPFMDCFHGALFVGFKGPSRQAVLPTIQEIGA
jgi:hypothetical protein